MITARLNADCQNCDKSAINKAHLYIRLQTANLFGRQRSRRWPDYICASLGWLLLLLLLWRSCRQTLALAIHSLEESSPPALKLLLQKLKLRVDTCLGKQARQLAVHAVCTVRPCRAQQASRMLDTARFSAERRRLGEMRNRTRVCRLQPGSTTKPTRLSLDRKLHTQCALGWKGRGIAQPQAEPLQLAQHLPIALQNCGRQFGVGDHLAQV